MLLRKFQNVSISDKSILNMAFPLHMQTQSKTGFHPANSKFNFKIKIGIYFNTIIKNWLTFFDYFLLQFFFFFFFVPFFFKRGTRLGKFI